MKKLIPSNLRIQVRVLQRTLVDLSNSQFSHLVNFQPISESDRDLFKPQITLSQVILPTQYSTNKKHNLNLAITRIQDVVIQPGKIFSFWHLVGKPDQAKGYREGRSLVGNQLKAEMGGGLCQLSGLLYFLTLKAGFPILERHPHSLDIYTEATRFAPLGSDATVVYGYKDLRFQNNLLFPVCFRFSLQKDEISATLCSPENIPEYQVEFKVEESNGRAKVDTVRFVEQTNTFEVLSSTIYKKLI
jgi:vancomycin resistance protein VanW